MTSLRIILNDQSGRPASPGREVHTSVCHNCGMATAPALMGRLAAPQSPDARGLERMSLDFMAPGSLQAPAAAHRPAPSRTGDHQQRQHSAAAAAAAAAASHHRSAAARGDGYPDGYHVAPAPQTPWTPVNHAHAARSSHGSTSSYSRRYSSSTASSYARHDATEPEVMEHSDTDRDSSRSPEPLRREPRLAYGEEERAFIMVCAVLRGMTWKEIEHAFRLRFPAGAKRRHAEVGLWPTYPEQERTAGGLTCAYYRIREQWGITKVRGVKDEQKPEVKNVVRQVVRSMTQFPDLQAWV